MGSCFSKVDNIEKLQNPRPVNERVNEPVNEAVNEPVNEVVDDGNKTKTDDLIDPTLQHILEAIYDAAYKAQTNVQLNNLHNMFWMFPERETDNVRIPKTIAFEIPNEEGTVKTVNIPIFAMVHQKHLTIDSLKIKTDCAIDLFASPSVKKQEHDIKNKKYQLKVSNNATNKTTNIEVFMKIEEPIEMYSRILHKLEQTV